MECIHRYADGSRLYRISARALCRVPIWKGNRIMDEEHVQRLKRDVGDTMTYLDSGYKVIQYEDMEEEVEIEKKSEKKKEKGRVKVKRSYVIDGQHRLRVLMDYFERVPDAPDFIVTVTEIQVNSEAEAIQAFNRINTVKPIQYEEDPSMIVNRYLKEILAAFPVKVGQDVFRAGRTVRPFLSSDKLRVIFEKQIQYLRTFSPAEIVQEFRRANAEILDMLRTQQRDNTIQVREQKIVQKMLDLEFALAWDDRFPWLKQFLMSKA